MAIYNLNEEADQLKGRRAGVVFQKIGNEFQIRIGNKPAHKNNRLTSKAKAKFQTVSTNFRNLSPGNKETFEDQISNYERINSLGEPYFLTSQTLYSMFNLNLIFNGLPLVNEADSPQLFPSLSPPLFLASATPRILSLDWDGQEVPPDILLVVRTTFPVSPGVSSVPSSLYVLTLLIPSGTISVIPFATIYESIHGTFNHKQGEKIFADYFLVHEPTGQRSETSEIFAIVA